MVGDAVAIEADTEAKDPVASVAGQIAHLSTGDRALLRRLYLAESSGSRARAADGVVLGLLHRAGVGMPSPPAYEAWRLLAHIAAILSGTGGRYAHAPARRFGTALHAAGYSENRFLRLTAARGPALHDQLRRAARMLAQAGEVPVDLWAILRLLGQDAAAAREARVRIAQDYYAAAARA